MMTHRIEMTDDELGLVLGALSVHPNHARARTARDTYTLKKSARLDDLHDKLSAQRTDPCAEDDARTRREEENAEAADHRNYGAGF